MRIEIVPYRETAIQSNLSNIFPSLRGTTTLRKLDPEDIRVIRGRLIFSIALVALYQPADKGLLPHEIRTHHEIEVYVMAFVLTLMAIWLPKKFRLAWYYISVTALTLLLGLWQWNVVTPHNIPMDFLLPGVVILAGAPPRYLKLTLGLGATIVLTTMIGSPSAQNVWNAIAEIGIYMGVRSIRGRREMEAMRRRYVAKLEATLSELKAAQAKMETDAAQSMHYAAQAERFRIARDIHDGLGHQLTSLIVQLQALSYTIPESLDEAHDRVSKILKVARAGLAEVRRSVRDWEEEDDNYGLAALTAVVEEARSNTDCSIDFETMVGERDGWPTTVQIVLYRVLQETLSNAIRHSDANHIDVRIAQRNREIRMTVEDNGSTNGVELTPGFGLRNMKARCEEIGGTCTWMTRPENGVRVEVNLPVS